MHLNENEVRRAPVDKSYRGFQRGEVYMARCGPWIGSIQGGIRPVLIVQNNTGNMFSPTLVVVKLTTNTAKNSHQCTHHTLSRVAWLRGNSQVLTEQICTINKEDILYYMGTLNQRNMRYVDRCLRAELDLADTRRHTTYEMSTEKKLK